MISETEYILGSASASRRKVTEHSLKKVALITAAAFVVLASLGYAILASPIP
jgi:hypothetical protein